MELFWSWCLSTLINAHRETPDGKEEKERARMKGWRGKFGENSTVEEDDQWEGEGERRGRIEAGGGGERRLDLTHGDDERK